MSGVENSSGDAAPVPASAAVTSLAYEAPRYDAMLSEEMIPVLRSTRKWAITSAIILLALLVMIPIALLALWFAALWF